MLTKTDIAKQLKTPLSTIVSYFTQYGDYIPSFKEPQARYPMYEEVAVEIIQLIMKRIGEEKKPMEIRMELDKKYPKTIDGNELTEQQNPPTTTLAQLANNQTLTTILEQLNRLKEHSRTLTETNESFRATVEQANIFMVEKDKHLEEYKSRLAKAEAELRDYKREAEAREEEATRKLEAEHETEVKKLTSEIENMEGELRRAKDKISKLEKGSLVNRLKKAFNG